MSGIMIILLKEIFTLRVKVIDNKDEFVIDCSVF